MAYFIKKRTRDLQNIRISRFVQEVEVNFGSTCATIAVNLLLRIEGYKM